MVEIIYFWTTSTQSYIFGVTPFELKLCFLCFLVFYLFIYLFIQCDLTQSCFQKVEVKDQPYILPLLFGKAGSAAEKDPTSWQISRLVLSKSVC